MPSYNFFLLTILLILLVSDTLFPKTWSDSSRRYRIISLSFISITILVLLFTFEFKTGVLTSKYHLIDDHDMLSSYIMTKNWNLLFSMRESLDTDLHFRFRPTYWMIRSVQTALFWGHFFLLHLSLLILNAMGMILAYIFARRHNCTRFVAAVFLMIIYVGPQSEILWRLGPQESTGLTLVFILLTLFDIYSTKHGIISYIGIFVFTFLVAGVKESFLLLIPILPIILTYMSDHPTSISDWIKKLFTNRLPYTIYTLVLFLASCLYIVTRLGTNSVEYAGINEEYKIKDYISSILKECTTETSIKWNIYVTIFALILIIFSLVYNHKEKKTILNAILYIGIAFYGLGTQFVLYAESGFYKRYILPEILIAAIIICLGLHSLNISSYSITAKVLALLCILPILYSYTLEEEAVKYAQNGLATVALIDDLGKNIDNNTAILSTLSVEESSAIMQYLSYYYNLNVNVNCDDSIANYANYDVLVGTAEGIEKVTTEKNIDLSMYEYHWANGFVFWEFH